MTIHNKAAIKNPALAAVSSLIGEWDTTGSHPYFPGVALHGHTTFEWLEGGAFLIMHNSVYHPDFPDGIALFGSDKETLYMLYFDERGISRKFDVTTNNNAISWVRNDADFSQRLTITVQDDKNSMESVGEMSQQGKPWEKDLSQKFARFSGPNS